MMAPPVHQHHHARRLAGAIAPPPFHQFATDFEQVTALVGTLGCASNAVRQRQLGSFAGKIGLLVDPITKGRPEAVDGAGIELLGQAILHCHELAARDER